MDGYVKHDSPFLIPLADTCLDALNAPLSSPQNRVFVSSEGTCGRPCRPRMQPRPPETGWRALPEESAGAAITVQDRMNPGSNGWRCARFMALIWGHQASTSIPPYSHSAQIEAD